MKPPTAKNIVHTLIIPYLTFVFILLFLGAGYAQPLKSQGSLLSFPGGKSGQEAITLYGNVCRKWHPGMGKALKVKEIPSAGQGSLGSILRKSFVSLQF